MRKIILLLGRPGAGKGTQATILSQWLRIPPVSTGDILREQIASVSNLTEMNEGALVSDDIVNSLVAQRVEKEDCANGFVLDGYPRNVSQAVCFRERLGKRDALLAIEIIVDEESLFSRLLTRRRNDDREDIIRERLRVYREQTLPVIDYFKSSGGFRRVDGAAPVENVADAIRSTVKEMLIRSTA